MTIDRREEMRRSLREKTEYDYSHGGESRMYSDIFQDVEGLQKWKCGVGQHLVDIIHYTAGDKDPQTKEGKSSHVLHIWVHQRVGPNQDTYVCPAINYKQPCPICEYREKLRNEENYDDDLVKSLYPKHRNIYNILCLDDQKEEAKGVQIWDVSDFFMGEKLRSISKMPDRGGKGGGYIYYADPEEGKTVKFERKGSGQQNTQFLGHQFVERDYTIDEATLNSAFQLDQIIIIPTYEELQNAFFGEEKEEGEGIEQQPPEAQKEEPPPESPKSPRLLRRTEEVKTQEEKPPKRTPVRQIPETKAEGECPAGGAYGVDCEDLKECGECEVWKDCSVVKDEMRAREAEDKKKKTASVPSKPAPSRTPIGGGTRRGGITGKR